MFNKHCWAHRHSVGHRSVKGFNAVMPSGKALLDLPDISNASGLGRMSDVKFQDTYCKNCSSMNCGMYKDIYVTMDKIAPPGTTDTFGGVPLKGLISQATCCSNKIDTASVGLTQNDVNNLAKILGEDVKVSFYTPIYFNAPTNSLDVAKVVGRVKHPGNDDYSLFCQALILDFDGSYLSLLFFDGRDWEDNDVFVDTVHIKMNIGGEIVDYDDILVTRVEDSCMLMLYLGEMDADEAVYCTKSAFRRIAEKVFSKVV